jgi:hypothetical protein
MSTVRTYRRLRIPTTWVVLLLALLAAVAIELAVVGLQRAAANQSPTSSSAQPHPATSGDFGWVLIA